MKGFNVILISSFQKKNAANELEGGTRREKTSILTLNVSGTISKIFCERCGFLINDKETF